MAGIPKELAQLRAPFPSGKKVGELGVDRGGVELGGGDHVGKGAGVAGDEGGHLVLPPFL